MTVLTIWLIGYLYTLGIERRLCDEKNEAMLVWDVIKIVITWPYYIGYLGVFQKAPEPEVEYTAAEPEVHIDDVLIER